MRVVSSLIVGAALLAAAAPALANSPSERAQARIAKTLEGRVAGKPVDCINLRSIRSTEIVDGVGIVYEVNSGKLYVNRPTNGVSNLDRDDILVTKTHGGQLCRMDIVRTVDRTSQFQTGFVGLGKFTPYTKPQQAD